MFEIRFCLEKCKEAKRDTLRKLALIYDPPGFLSPVHLMIKIIYRMICEKNPAWDNTILSEIIRFWDIWESSLIQKIEIPRSTGQSIGVTKTDLHVFYDFYTCFLYIVAHHPGGPNQGQIAIKSRLAKKKKQKQYLV